MKIKLVIFFFFLSLVTFSLNSRAKAQEALPTPSQEVNTQPTLPQSEEGLPENDKKENESLIVMSEENTQSFTNGALVGVIVGFILGGTVAWIFKKKFEQI